MIAEFYRPRERPPAEAPAAPSSGGAPAKPPSPEIVGRARWEDARARVEAQDPEVEAALRRVFRATAVTAGDATPRTKGAEGPSVIQPGSLEWFRWAAFTRAPEEGLAARLVASTGPGGWDPAANYRTFREQVRRLQSR